MRAALASAAIRTFSARSLELQHPRSLVQIGGPQPLAGKQVARLLLRDRDLNACFSRDHVFTKCLSSFALTASTPPKHAPLKLPEHSLRHIRSSMCSGGMGTIQLRADPKDTQTTAPGLHHVIDATRGRPPRPFRNVDAPPAAFRPPPSPPCSVYQSLSIGRGERMRASGPVERAVGQHAVTQ